MIVSVPFAFQVRSLQGLVKLETERARRTARKHLKPLRFPLEQGESFSDLSSLTCARQAVRLASSVSNLITPAISELGMRKAQILS